MLLSTEDKMKAEIKRYTDHGFSLKGAAFQVNQATLGRHTRAIDKVLLELEEAAKVEPKTFTAGQIATARSVCNYDCIF